MLEYDHPIKETLRLSNQIGIKGRLERGNIVECLTNHERCLGDAIKIAQHEAENKL